MYIPTAPTHDDIYITDLRLVVNTIADQLKEEAAAYPENPEAQAAWIRAEVGRAALELGVEDHDLVLLGELLQEALRGGTGVWRIEL